jgi:hypothetical protein
VHFTLQAIYQLLYVCRKQKMLRCVVREDLSYEMATDLINDMNKCIEWLDHHFIYSGEFDVLSNLQTVMSSLMPDHTSDRGCHKLVALIQVWSPYKTDSTNLRYSKWICLSDPSTLY